LAIRPARTINHLEVRIGHSAADRRVQSVNPNDRNASGLRTENLTPAAKADKPDKHASQKVTGNAEYYGDRNREYQVDGSNQDQSSVDRIS